MRQRYINFINFLYSCISTATFDSCLNKLQSAVRDRPCGAELTLSGLFRKKKKSNSSLSLFWIQLCSLCSKVFRAMERKLFQPPVSPLCLHRSTVMMTLRRDSAAGGVRLSLLSSRKANIRQHLHHSFVFRGARCAAGCTLIKHTSVFFIFYFTYERNFTCLAPFSSEALCSDSCLNTIMLL